MNSKTTLKGLSFVLSLSLVLGSCGNSNTDPSNNEVVNVESKKKGNSEVVVHELGDPDKLNPITSTSAGSTYIVSNIYSALMAYTQDSLLLKPQIAVDYPEVTTIDEGEYAGGMSITFEIHPDAAWDNGSPVLASDYVFSLKAIKNPRVSAGPIRPYYEFINDVVIDEQNPKKFTIYSKQRYFVAVEFSGGLAIIPEYIYDPKGLMRDFTIKELNDPRKAERLSNNPQIVEFAKEFDSPKFDREVVEGSGPYKFIEWKTGQEIVLERKKDWWGDKVQGNSLLEAKPSKLVYKIIKDKNAAVLSIRNEELDVMRGINPSDFKSLREDKPFTSLFELTTPDQFAYYYLGFNSRDPKFADKNVRRAFAHLIDRDKIIDALYNGLAIKLNSPINPNKEYYANDLPDIEFDRAKARQLLEEAGWKDLDGDGVLDKKIGGKIESMRIKYKYNKENTIRRDIGLLLQDQARHVGIEIEIVGREWTVFLEDTKRRDFEVMCLAWVQGPGLDDMKQIWHTESDTHSGSNRVGFGSAESDQIIDSIRVTLDPQKRNALYKRIQEIIYEDQPYVFLFVPSERIGIHRRYTNSGTSAMRPGYNVTGFGLKEGM